MKDLRNPLGYWCAPNEASPEYVPSSTAEDFIGYALYLCYLDEDSTSCKVGAEEIYWLREDFLSYLKGTVEYLDEMLDGFHPDYPLDDEGSDGISLDCPPEDSDNYESVWWRADQYSEGAVSFEWCWSSSPDRIAIWVEESVLRDPHTLEVIELAKTEIEKYKP